MAEKFFRLGLCRDGGRRALKIFIKIFVKIFSKPQNRPDFEKGAHNSSKVIVFIMVYAKSVIPEKCKISESLCFILGFEDFVDHKNINILLVLKLLEQPFQKYYIPIVCRISAVLVFRLYATKLQ